ncbi:arginosuccinate synthase [Leptospira selangorensis]|uniref:Arginosuccinate synthase n=1 Tax=Leptospira selangorensis TaxID=2484982 RepID=A0A5F2BZI4_9LEPT|nr:ATP-binding protein [Leptospira selangorensis]TGM15890.1 arginosuccinate synthase [Leptospira selangorensis]TGM18161.1 arginosuccinate synthase [Leptospira selangorensis]
MNETLESIFQSAWSRLKNYQNFMKSKPAVIAFSGGKDSSLLLQFYLWLHNKNLISHFPTIYHLDHSIRDNGEQESDILKYIHSISPDSTFKKKKFRSLQLRQN